MIKRALVVGHLSTFGDVEVLHRVERILQDASFEYEVCPLFSDQLVDYLPTRAIPIALVDPKKYSHLIVVCGPVWPGLLEKRGIDLLAFEHAIRIGVNLTMVQRVDEWNPFHLLLERDSNRTARPDLALVSEHQKRVVVGLCLIDSQPEYQDRQQHFATRAMFDEAIAQNEWATVSLDTKWPKFRNQAGISSAEDFNSIVKKMDFILTNRLHGMVLGLKSGVPVIAIDSVKGGDKVLSQARILGWPACVLQSDASLEWINEMGTWASTNDAKLKVTEVVGSARLELLKIESELLAGVLNTEFPIIPIQDNDFPVRKQANLIKKLRHRAKRMLIEMAERLS